MTQKKLLKRFGPVMYYHLIEVNKKHFRHAIEHGLEIERIKTDATYKLMNRGGLSREDAIAFCDIAHEHINT